ASEDHRVVGVPPANALRRIEVVASLQAEAGDLLDDADELVDRDELRRAQVDRVDDVADHDLRRSVEAVVDIPEAPGLLAASPDLDLVAAGKLRLRNLATDRRGRLLTTAVVRPVRSVDVVVARHPSLDAVVVVKVPAHPLGEELLPAVAV